MSGHTATPWRFERTPSAVEYAELTGKSLAGHEGYFRSNGGDWIVTHGDFDGGGEAGQICEVAFKGKAKRGQAYNAPDPVGQANAEFIVRAVNSHEALLSLVRRFVALHGTAWHPERHASEESELMQEARDFLQEITNA